MLDQLASHGLLDMHVKAKGDIHIDDHHTNEDIGLAIGTALLEALGDRKGINRFGDFSAPLDESLIHVALDLSGRPHLSYDLQIPTQRVGTYDTQDFLAGRTLLPVRGQHFWSDTSYTTASWKKFSSHY
ncbi:unnamed protein product [Cuscuta europaea]|uniref:imidazoleglycerol-phosphate dehydratase n=1 Tax=Cuscuta europaea TaxID=41803 RepID=A0A9P0YXQ2_CUSEU|nr:unnamed protein product [Cuscuta europaea]